MIVEMAGRPAKHLTESLEKHINILNDVKDITVHSIKISKPRKIETSKDQKDVPSSEIMFTAFVEADFECNSFARLSETMFDFMPSSVEVIEPGKITMDMNEATDLLNNISGRLHRYDEIAKVIGAKYQQIEAQLQMTQKSLVKEDSKVKRPTKKKITKKK